MSYDIYDKDYYKNGIRSGKSGYQDYRWMPFETVSMVRSMINYLDIKKRDSILDYGCAFGYVVKAFRRLGFSSWGVDVSEYAISQADPEVADFCTLLPEVLDIGFDWCIAKDVFEHIGKYQLPTVLKSIHAQNMFVVVPLGENGKYYNSYNDLDITHVVCEPLDWWLEMFLENGWSAKMASYCVPGIKDMYRGHDHGFFTLQRKGE